MCKIYFSSPKLTNKVKDWQMSFFYCNVKDIEDEHPLPGFRESRLEFHDGLNLFPMEKMEKKNKPLLARIKALLAHGLAGRDLVRCWVGGQIQPLSIRNRLMCDYNGTGDPMCFAHNEMTSSALATCCKKFVAERIDDLKKVGLAPFFQGNPAPTVRFLLPVLLGALTFRDFNLPTSCIQENKPFWSAGQDLEIEEEADAENQSNVVRASLCISL